MLATGMTCPDCDTAVSGKWSACECRYCRLSEDHQALLEVFLASRGNVRELERFLGVSYPTARARLEALLAALGLAESAPTADQRQSRLDILKGLAEGELGLDDAASALGELRGS
jgi:hypothetical protein